MATNELNKNLSDLVKWSDDIYLRKQIKHLNYRNNNNIGQLNLDIDPEEEDEDETTMTDDNHCKLIDNGAIISRKVFISFKVCSTILCINLPIIYLN